MVSQSAAVIPIEGLVHTESATKCFLGSEDYGSGTLYITEHVLQWIGQNRNIKLNYPSISLHAISRDTTNFPHECLFCLLESAEALESDERDPLPEVTEVRFVPDDRNNIQAMYDAVTRCQELHPDPDDVDSEDEMLEDEGYDATEDVPDINNLQGFYTSADNLDNVELSEEGQAVLARLQQNMQIASQQEFTEMVGEQPEQNGHANQFDDADEME